MRNPFLNALAAALYIAGVVLLLVGMERAGGPDGIFLGMAMLALLVLSVACMGFLFFFRPLELFMAGDREGAVRFFITTLVLFAAITTLLFLAASFAI